MQKEYTLLKKKKKIRRRRRKKERSKTKGREQFVQPESSWHTKNCKSSSWQIVLQPTSQLFTWEKCYMILCKKQNIFVNKYWFDRKSDKLHFLLKDMYLSTRCQTEFLYKEKKKKWRENLN